MKLLLENKSLAVQLGNEGKKTAQERFNIQRFAKEWKEVFERAINKQTQSMKQTAYITML